jgi:SNF2 family DNA or RNA helicase
MEDIESLKAELRNLPGSINSELELAAQAFREKKAELRRRKLEEEARLRNAIRAAELEEELRRRKLDEERLRDVRNREWYKKAYDYQREDSLNFASWGYGFNGNGVGTGKSLEMLGTIDRLGTKLSVVVVRAPLVNNWVDEARRWLPEDEYLIMSIRTEAERSILSVVDTAINNGIQVILVINYEAWRGKPHVLEGVINLGPELIITDESTDIKEDATLAHKGLMTLAYAKNFCPVCKQVIKGATQEILSKTRFSSLTDNPLVDGYEHKPVVPVHCNSSLVSTVKHRYALSGTPILNRPEELWAQLHFIDRKKWDNKNSFLLDYCSMGSNRQWYFPEYKLNKLIRSLKGLYVAREIKLNTPGHVVKFVELTLKKETYAEQWEHVRNIQTYASLAMEGGEVEAVTALVALMTREMQITDDPNGVVIPLRDENNKIIFDTEHRPITRQLTCDRNIKHDAALFIIRKSLRAKKRVVVFSKFNQSLKGLHDSLQREGVTSAILSGGTPEKKRIEIRKDALRVNGTSKFDVLLVNTAVGDMGLNLTAYSTIICLNQPWSPKTLEQMIARVDRTGQTEEVPVFILVIKSTIDQYVEEVLRRKDGVTNALARESSIVENYKENRSNYAL